MMRDQGAGGRPRAEINHIPGPVLASREEALIDPLAIAFLWLKS